MSNKTILSVKGLSVTFTNQEVVHQISFSVSEINFIKSILSSKILKCSAQVPHLNT